MECSLSVEECKIDSNECFEYKQQYEIQNESLTVNFLYVTHK